MVAAGCGPREETAFGYGGEAQGFQFRGGPMSRQTVGSAKGLCQVSGPVVILHFVRNIRALEQRVSPTYTPGQPTTHDISLAAFDGNAESI